MIGHLLKKKRKKKGKGERKRNGDLAVILNTINCTAFYSIHKQFFYWNIDDKKHSSFEYTSVHYKDKQLWLQIQQFWYKQTQVLLPCIIVQWTVFKLAFRRPLAFHRSDGPTLESSASLSFYGVNLTIINCLDAKFLYFTFLPTPHHSFS